MLRASRVARRVPLFVGSSLIGAGAVAAATPDGALSKPPSGGVVEAVRSVAVGVPRFVYAVGSAGVVAADYKLLAKVAQWKGLDPDSDDFKEREKRVHLRAANRILSMSLSMGGLWVKLAQYVSTLKPMVPGEFTDTLGIAQDKALGRSYEEVAQVLEAQLGAPPEELFAYFEREPIASASIAQVHRAVTLDGERVAVKVQYPSLPRQLAADIAALRAIAWLWGVFYPDYDLQWILPEFEESLLSELDFRQEAVTGERALRMLSEPGSAHASLVHVPAIRWDLTAQRVMTMEWIDGVKPTRTDSVRAMGVDPLRVAATACAVFADMVFVHGIVHIDPHPGNVLVRHAPPGGPRGRATGLGLWPDSGPGVGRDADAPRPATDPAASSHRPGDPWQLVVLDHGMYRRLSPSFRQAYCALWEALLLRDEALGQRAAVQMGLKGDAYDALSLVLTYRLGKRGSQAELKGTMKRLATASKEDQREFFKQLPRDFFFVGRNTNMVRGLNLALGGTTRDRIAASGDAAVRGMALNDDVWGVRELLALGDAAEARDVTLPSWWWPMHRALGIGGGEDSVAGRTTLPANPHCRLNEPTDSELSAWLRTPAGRAAVDAATAGAGMLGPERASAALEADARRQATPESNMGGLAGGAAELFGSAASAAGYDTTCSGTGRRRIAKESTPSASLVALATSAAAEARERAANSGTLGEALRRWGAWWAVARVRMTVSFLDFQMWAFLAFRSLLAGGGLEVETNWGEFGAGSDDMEKRRRARWNKRIHGEGAADADGAGKEDDEAVEELRPEDDPQRSEYWADTAPADLSDAEREHHARSMATVSRSQMG